MENKKSLTLHPRLFRTHSNKPILKVVNKASNTNESFERSIKIMLNKVY